MIREVAGDIVLSESEWIAHGVAPMDDFQSGLGASMKQAFPEMAAAFIDYCKRLHPMPGDAWQWNGPGKKIVCLFTQQQALKKGDKPGPATVEAVEHALANLKKFVTKGKARSLALSKIATGAGGLPWEKVKPVIEKSLGELAIPVVVYTKHEPGVGAE
ncbi:MAG TPA: macro domain-containing protein [Planctomycetota bacterium]|nr:macro domain-containing protein [Planctomycetota bacterium]